MLTLLRKFGEPVKIPLIERDDGPYQVILQDGIPVLKPSGGKNAEITDNFVNSFVGFSPG